MGLPSPQVTKTASHTCGERPAASPSSHIGGAMGGVKGPPELTQLPPQIPGQWVPLCEDRCLLGGEGSDLGPLSS